MNSRMCGADDVLQVQLKTDPSLRSRMDRIEELTQRAIKSGSTKKLAADGFIEIPVVFHIIYNTAAQNLVMQQIQSQLDVLNDDFQNSHIEQLPANSFQNIVSPGMKFRFVLDNVIRVKTSKTIWPANDAMKYSKYGGSDVVDPENKLNIWSVNLQDYLGYAQFPGGNPSTDGVVILYSALGSKKLYPAGNYIRRFDLGRTATHEVGHWMNLRHIWGDDGGSCNGSDKVDDTPNQGAENYGTPSFPHPSCDNFSDMFMNYMDYTDDKGMYVFSAGQKERALAVFATGTRKVMGH
jgi:hypothetical protein